MQIASTVWIDAIGNTRITLIRSNAGVGGILSSAAACTNAQPLECWEGPQSLYTPTPTSGQYGNAAVVARLVFACADGTEASVYLFAPLLSIFLADQTTVNPANAAVAALIAACVGNLESASGSLAVGYVSGTTGPRPQGAG